MSELSFQRDILPLFRSEDIESMTFAFDLSSHDEVSAHAAREAEQEQERERTAHLRAA